MIALVTPRTRKPTLGPSALLHGAGHDSRGGSTSSHAPTTRAETAFYLRQIEHATPLVVKLRDGEELRGVLDWHDRASLRVNLAGGGHRIVQKAAISTICKSA